MRKCDNSFAQYRTEIDGLGIHFIHARSKHAEALPVILTHGWPGSIVEFLNLIDPLTKPTGHGGKPEDAFHLIAPSLLGFGFFDKPTNTGWTFCASLRRGSSRWSASVTGAGSQGFLQRSNAPSARIYWENKTATPSKGQIDIPVAVSVIPHEDLADPSQLALTGVFVRVRRQIRSRWQRFAG
jgi:hypothetical protein